MSVTVSEVTAVNARDRDREREEIASAITHGIGALGAIAATAVLVILASLGGDPWKIVGAAIFGGTLILLYTASTIYHAVRTAHHKTRLKILDHCAIYLLIAGSYTPFTIGAMRGAWGWSMFGVIWGLALAGVVFKLFYAGRFRVLSTAIYIFMGWLMVIAIGPMLRSLSPATIGWLVAGGIAYTAGTPLYHATRIRYSHALWHLFVLTGSACHAVAVGTHI